MGLGPAAVRLYLELWQRGVLANVRSVVEMGSQEMHLTKTQFEGLVRSAGVRTYDESAFADLVHWPGTPRCSARSFYGLLGADEYRCIDLNKVYGAIPHDLNAPFTDASLYERFDLVTDHGTNEHVFNVAETYRTMHRLCKPGGLIVICQNTYGGNGYFNFDLSFFEGMAAANGYGILFSSFFVTLDRKYLSTEEVRGLPAALGDSYGVDQLHVPLSNELLDVMRWSKDSTSLGICYVFQKRAGGDFRYAYQGELLARVEGHLGFQLQFLPEPPSRSYVPVRGLAGRTGQDDILRSIPFRAIVQHVVRRIAGRIGGAIARRG